MRRRGLLALLAPLTAGCLGGIEVSREGAQSVPEDRSETTPAPERGANATATPTPDTPSDSEPTPAPGADERTAARRLRVAEESLAAAVSAFGEGQGVADVTADEAFVARDVYVELVRASGAVDEARALARTESQVERARALSGVVAFLSHATAGQAAIAAGHEAIVDVPEALRDGNVGRARALVDEFGTHRRETERAASRVRSRSDDADVEATDVVADDARRLKLAQFDAAVTALGDATQPARSLITGVDRLIEARSALTDDSYDDASSFANDAEVVLDEAESDLSTLADDLSAEAAAFVDAIDRLATYAGNRATEAADIRRNY
ncbi:MAG: hypothetical protein ABEJ43_07000 [Haloferacaceae archaeon]